MQEATIHLKSGGSFKFKAKKIVATRSRPDNELTNISWEGFDHSTPEPLYVRLEDVSAVVVRQMCRRS